MQNNFRHSLCYFGRRKNLLVSEKKVRVTSTPSYSANAIFGGDTHNYSRTNITIHKPKNPIITGPYRSIRFVRGFCKLWIVGWPCVSMHGERFLKDSSLLHRSIRLAVERRPPFWILHRPPAKSLQATSLVSRALSQRAKTESWSFCDLYYSFRHSLPTWENLRGIFEAILYFFHTVSHQISIVHFANNEEIPLHKRVTKDCVLFRSFHYRHPLLPCPFIQWTKSSLRGRKSLFANRVIITTENHRSTWKQVVLFSSG